MINSNNFLRAIFVDCILSKVIHNIKNMDSSLGVLLKNFMQWGQERVETLSQNIAHANTPKYLAKDVAKPQSFAALVGTNAANTPLAVTSPMHIKGDSAGRKFKTELDKTAGEAKINGNNVSLPDQAMKLEDTRADYANAAKAYSMLGTIWATVTGKK